MRRQARLRPVEREQARRLATVYRDGAKLTPDVASAHAGNEEQDLPWKRDFDRACYIQDVAWRYAKLLEARR